MEQKQIEQEVEALEPRLERLRSLYEQYFMGLEKIEPSTVRRDVDRKFWQLRKLRIQNTALRFRLQMLIQRYNTYQQYWARVMREMERGTYRRDVLRAAKRVGSAEAMTLLGKRRAKMFQKLAAAQEERKKRAASTAEQQERDLEEAADEFDESTSALEEALQAAVQYVEKGAVKKEQAAPVEATGSVAEADDDAPTMPPPPPVASTDDDAPTVPPPPPAEKPASSAPASLIDPTQWDLFSDDEPSPTARAGGPDAPRAAGLADDETAAEAPAAARIRQQPSPHAIGLTPDLGMSTTDDDDAPTMPPPAGATARALGAASMGIPRTPGPARDEGVSSAAVPTSPAPPAAPARPSPPPPAAEPKTSPAPPPVAPEPQTSPSPPPAAAEPETGPAPPVEAASRERPRRPRPAPARGARSTKPTGDDARGAASRELFETYVAAKKAANESTSGLTYEKMARSLSKQTERLRKKHGNRKIDYEVVTKDGRALIRPKIK